MDSYINQGSKDTRSGFGEGLTELGRIIPISLLYVQI